jgi:L,D-transpeptidase-like protein
MLKRTLTPVVLLALLVSFVAASPQAQVAAAPEAKAAPAPAAVAAAPAAPAAALAAVATPAVATPATLAIAKGAQGLSPKVLAMALDAVACARARGVSGRDDLLTVIDYSLPSTQPRLWVLDLAKGEVLYHELVAHGRGSGDNYATRFSNLNDSHQTSLGLFRTGGTYVGGNGYSLKLQGLDEGINDRAEARAIVMHGAWYVSAEHARSQGRLGRSWGCPALSEASARTVIDTIKGGSFIFSYGGDKDFQKASSRSCGGSENPAPSPVGAAATVAIAG